MLIHLCRRYEEVCEFLDNKSFFLSACTNCKTQVPLEVLRLYEAKNTVHH